MKRTISLLVLIPLITLLASCTQSYDAAAILDKLTEASFCGAGLYYESGVYEWEEGYLTDSTKRALFANAAGECDFDTLVESYAIYLSSSKEGGEIMVLVCFDRGDAEVAAQMCYRRVDLAKKVNKELADHAVVYVKDRCVVFAMIGDGLDVDVIREAAK